MGRFRISTSVPLWDSYADRRGELPPRAELISSRRRRSVWNARPCDTNVLVRTNAAVIVGHTVNATHAISCGTRLDTRADNSATAAVVVVIIEIGATRRAATRIRTSAYTLKVAATAMVYVRGQIGAGSATDRFRRWA